MLELRHQRRMQRCVENNTLVAAVLQTFNNAGLLLSGNTTPSKLRLQAAPTDWASGKLLTCLVEAAADALEPIFFEPNIIVIR